MVKINDCIVPFIFDRYQISHIEEEYDCHYLLDTQLVDGSGKMTDSVASFFYCENPNKEEGHSHYLGVFPSDNEGEIVLFDGEPTIKHIAGKPIWGAFNDSGVFVYSVHRNDFAYVNENLSIDGGRDYLRVVGEGELKKVVIEDSDVYAVTIH